MLDVMMKKLYCDITYPHCKVRETLNSSHKSNQSSPCKSELLPCQLDCIAIRESEAQFRSLILQIPAITYIADLNKPRTSLYISHQIEDLLGYTQEEFQDDPELWKKTIYPDDHNRVLKELARNRSSGKPFVSEYRVFSKDGRVKWFRDEARIVFNDKGQPTSLQGVMFDITECKQAEETLRMARDELNNKVKERTVELTKINVQLHQEIEERKQTEKKLRKYQKQLAALSSELLLTEESERRQIARDLHDRISQNLAISCNKIEQLKMLAATSKISNAIHDIETLIRQTIRDTRTLTFEISPPILYELGLEPALEWLSEQIYAQYNIPVKFFDDGALKPLDNRARVLVFRATRELMLNVVKHASARHVKVSVFRKNDAIYVEVTDDGCGFELSERKLPILLSPNTPIEGSEA
jgi:PAS domain S-box-containing protein